MTKKVELAVEGTIEETPEVLATAAILQAELAQASSVQALATQPKEMRKAKLLLAQQRLEIENKAVGIREQLMDKVRVGSKRDLSRPQTQIAVTRQSSPGLQ